MARRKRAPRISRAELKRMRNFEIGGSPVGQRFRGYTQPGGGFEIGRPAVGYGRPGSRQTLDEFGELLGQLEKSRQRQASDKEKANAEYDQQKSKADQRQTDDQQKAKTYGGGIKKGRKFEALLRARMGKF